MHVCMQMSSLMPYLVDTDWDREDDENASNRPCLVSDAVVLAHKVPNDQWQSQEGQRGQNPPALQEQIQTVGKEASASATFTVTQMAKPNGETCQLCFAKE